MSAVWLPAKTGDGMRPVAAVESVTPGVFLWRDRQGERCNWEECDHELNHGQAYEQCPDAGWGWRVGLACGLHITSSADRLHRADSARKLAAALGAWPVDWTAPAEALTAYAASAAGQEHLKLWVWEALLLEAGVQPEHAPPCSHCPPLPDITPLTPAELAGGVR